MHIFSGQGNIKMPWPPFPGTPPARFPLPTLSEKRTMTIISEHKLIDYLSSPIV
jgi:hypothetical protein